MSKITKKFDLPYTISRKWGKRVESVEVQVTGTFYCHTNQPKDEPFDRYDIDIDTVNYRGQDIREVIYLLDQLEDMENYLLEYHAADCFDDFNMPDFANNLLSNVFGRRAS